MAITYLLRNKTLPGMPPRNPDPRTTDDKFVIEVSASDNPKHSLQEIATILKNTGVIELEEKVIKEYIRNQEAEEVRQEQLRISGL